MQLVATDARTFIGILDIEVDGDLATIDAVAVHPDHQSRGVASLLLDRAWQELPAAVSVIDAWTREGVPALAWYRGHGFAESEHYLYVHKACEDPDAGWASPAHLSAPVTAFCHARLEDEADLRERFSRFYVCRRFSRSVLAW